MNTRKSMLLTVSFLAITGLLSANSHAGFAAKHADLRLTLPDKPLTDVVEIGSGVMQHRLIINRPNGTVIVWYQDEAANIVDPLPSLKRAQETIEKMAGGRLLSEKIIEVDGNPGRMFTVTIPEKDGEFRVTYLYASGKHYQVMSVGTRDFTRSSEIDEMFQSMKFVN